MSTVATAGSVAGGASASAAAAKPVSNRLRDLKIRSFAVAEFTKPPVVVIHGPRESGISTLIASLLIETQNSYGLNGVVVLTDRNTEHYMGGTIPQAVIMDRPFEHMLNSLIELQRHRNNSTVAVEQLRLAIVVDDVLYNPKILRSEAVQRNIKLAKEFNIMIVIATSDVTILPPNVHTFATHVIATKCISVEEPKLLQKRMFCMFDSALALADTLALCQPHEFLVGLLRSSLSCTLLDFSRSYIPTYYVKSPEFARDEDFWKGDRSADSASTASGGSTKLPPPATTIGEFHMSPELIVQITARGLIRPAESS
jgi:hypothetical protein